MLGLFAAPAWTQQPPEATDIELVRPGFGHGGLSGVDVPTVGRSMTLRYGAYLQYEDASEPLAAGKAPGDRIATTLGASLDVDRTTWSVTLPAGASTADGVGLGDLSTRVRWIAARGRDDQTALGIRGGLSLPTGRRDAFLGVQRLRIDGALLASARTGALTVAADAGLQAPLPRSGDDAVSTSELATGIGGRLDLPASSRLGLTAQLLTRSGLDRFLSSRPADRPGVLRHLGGVAEAVGGVQIHPSRRATVGIGVGRRLTRGLGTTDLRLITSLVIEAPPPPPARPIGYAYEPRGCALVMPPPSPRPAWDAGDEIVSLGEIGFAPDTATLLPSSIPTLEAVADVLLYDGGIGHVVIEVPSSRDAGAPTNLADPRGRRIWEWMLEHGVFHERISYLSRSEGEPPPGDDALPEPSVRFHISARFQPGEPLPVYPQTQMLPWSGEVVPVVRPFHVDEFGLPIVE